MRTLLFLLSGFLVLFSTRFCAQTPEWVRTSSHAQPSFGETGSALDVDALGNSIFAGDYVFGATINGVTFLSGSTSVANCFVSTANASGAFNWVMQISGTGAKAITDAKWTSSGEVLVCGFFAGTITAGSATATSAGALDLFLLRLSNSGTVLSLQRFGGLLNDYANSLDIDSAGRVFIAGSFNGSFTFGSSPLTAVGSEDACLLAFSPTFTPLWAVRCGGSLFDRSTEVVCDNLGGVYIAFEFSGSLTFDAVAYTSAGMLDVLLAKLDASNGAVLWAIRSGGTAGDFCTGIDFDGVSTVFFGGNTTANFQIGTLTAMASGCSDVYLCAISDMGIPLWLNTYGVAGSCESLSDIAFGAGGYLFFLGNYNAPTTFGSVSLSNGGLNDAFLVKADPLGAVISANRASSTRNDLFTKVAVNDAGMVFVVGTIYGNTQIGTIQLTVAGGLDAVLAKYNSALLLPASVHDFTAEKKASTQSTFHWISEEEVNNAWFVLEQSADGENYQELARTEGRGTSFGLEYYSLEVTHTFRPLWYYRLVQIETDGSSSIVGRLELNYEQENTAVFFQPSWKKIVVQLPSYLVGVEWAKVEVFDTSLRAVQATQTSYHTELSTEQWPAGVYIVTIQIGQERESFKVAVY